MAVPSGPSSHSDTLDLFLCGNPTLPDLSAGKNVLVILKSHRHVMSHLTDYDEFIWARVPKPYYDTPLSHQVSKVIDILSTWVNGKFQ